MHESRVRAQEALHMQRYDALHCTPTGREDTMRIHQQHPGFIFTHARGVMAAALCVASLFMAGCETKPRFRPLTSDAPPPPVFVTVTGDADCQVAQARYALGRAIDAPLLEEMRARTGSRSARTAPVGTPLPAPADPGRLNVDVDPQGRITGARCG
jgi:hypothetical protein